MQRILIIALSILILSCKNDSIKENTNEQIEESINFDWLLGKWERLNEDEDKKTFENWLKVNDSEYVGIGFTMQNADTIKQERMQLVNKEGKWDLKVKTPDEKDFITFEMTNLSENEFICENTEIDFPNKIKYWIEGDRMSAVVSNSEIEISFEFEKFKK